MASPRQHHQSSSPPSSPLSVLSQSPSPPSPVLDISQRYPSPSSSFSTLTPGTASPLKPFGMAESTDEIRVRTDGPPPAKRRRTAGPTKPRTTAYIDLENPRGDGEDENLERLISALRKKKKIVVIAGAGISVSAGIPDFRSSTGLFATLRGQHKLKACGKHLFDASVYKHDSSTESFHAMVRELAQMTAGAKPTPFHHMLASIAAEGRLMRMYSQNIDTLDTQMPPLATTVPLNCKGPWPTTIQLHGGLEKMVCTKCGHLEPFNASLFQGPEPPLCENCKEQDQVRTTFAGKRSHGIGRLRPRIVLYNEYNPDEEAIGNVSKADLRRVPDAVIVVGTSLKIPGVRRIVKEMCQLTRSRRDGITAWINLEPEPQGVEFKDCWDLVVRGKCDDIAELVSLPRWDQQDIGEPDTYMISGDEQREKRCADCLNRGRIDVLLEARRRTSVDQEGFGSSVEAPSAAGREPKLLRNGGMPTPSASPRVRSPLPSVKPMAKPATKQSTLVFGNSAVSKPAAKPRKGATNKRNPRQPKKEPIKPRNRLDQTFRTIKAAAAAAVPSKDKDNAKTPQNRPSSEEEADSSSSDLSSPLDLPGDYLSLPSLRPTPSVGKKPSPLKVSPHPPPSNSSGPLGALGWAAAEGKGTAASASSEPPRTPTENTNADNAPGVAATISPKSKPRSMGHLID